MAASLVPCSGCQRHVRSSERSCPFCGAELASTEPVQELRLLTRLDRSRMVALGAVLTAAGIIIGCREPTPAPVYGGPPPEAPEPAAPTMSAPSAPSTVVAPSASEAAPPTSASAAPSSPPAPKPQPTAKAKPVNPNPGAPVAAYGAPPKMPGPDGFDPKKP